MIAPLEIDLSFILYQREGVNARNISDFGPDNKDETHPAWDALDDTENKGFCLSEHPEKFGGSVDNQKHLSDRFLTGVF